jgi:mannose-6-phosphate isomerase-like protein (cupin superfamily)
MNDRADNATTSGGAATGGSPRPTFESATHIRARDVTLHLWGEEESGEVADWIYVSSDKIHHLMFGLAPGQRFGHSSKYRTVFAADELFYVVSGTLVLSDPETGEAQLVQTGEAVFFRRDTWHHAVSFGPDQLRVIEFFSPPPSTGASSTYSRTRELLIDVKRGDNRWIGRWPMASTERAATQSFRVLRDADLLWRIDGVGGGAMCGLYVSTEHLTAGITTLRSGGMTDVHRHAGDLTLQVLSGTVNVLLPAAESKQQRWFELAPNDGFFVPQGVPYQFRNVTDTQAKLVFAVAPDYLEPTPG